jgi:hypothetical protein
MIIDTKLARAFNKAVTNLDNIHMGTQEGEINWNFVDADCYMAMTAGNPLFDTREEGQSYVDQFEYLAACYTGEITLADRIQQEFKIEIDGEDFTFLTQEEYDAISIDKSKPIIIKELV